MELDRARLIGDRIDGLQQAMLDIGLPKLSGHDACRHIRQQPWSRNMVIVALTGWGQDADRRKSQEAGFDAHMVKPLDYTALMKLLATSSERGRLTNAIGHGPAEGRATARRPSGSASSRVMDDAPTAL